MTVSNVIDLVSLVSGLNMATPIPLVLEHKFSPPSSNLIMQFCNRADASNPRDKP